jgi:hypothetical protein
MINYKFRRCYKKMDIYKSIGFSTTNRGPVGSSLADRLPAAADAPRPTCMLLYRRACYCSGACGAPRDKFRGPEMHFQSSRAYVTQTYKFRGLYCI